MPPLPNSASIWYCPSSTVLTIDAGSASRTSPSKAQKLTLSSYFVLQAVQYFIRDLAAYKRACSLSRVNLAGILFDHPITVELRRKRLNGTSHHCDPLARQSLLAIVV